MGAGLVVFLSLRVILVSCWLQEQFTTPVSGHVYEPSARSKALRRATGEWLNVELGVMLWKRDWLGVVAILTFWVGLWSDNLIERLWCTNISLVLVVQMDGVRGYGRGWGCGG